MWNDEENQVHAHMPEESPRGLGFSGILTSDMFGLRTTLDNTTEDLLRLRREFIEKDTLTEKEKIKLKKLDKKINEYGFSTTHWDVDYSEYLRQRKHVEQEISTDDVATPEQIKLRKQKAQEIIKKLVNDRKPGSR